jgi:hypothetical protein
MHSNDEKKDTHYRHTLPIGIQVAFALYKLAHGLNTSIVMKC